MHMCFKHKEGPDWHSSNALKPSLDLMTKTRKSAVQTKAMVQPQGVFTWHAKTHVLQFIQFYA